MDRAQIETLLNEVQTGSTSVPMRWIGCAICPSKIWDSPSSIIIAR